MCTTNGGTAMNLRLLPPLGYDDETVVPHRRLYLLLGKFEEELLKVQKELSLHMPIVMRLSNEMQKIFADLRASAEELGQESLFSVEKLISDYDQLSDDSGQEVLEVILNDIKSLQLLLG